MSTLKQLHPLPPLAERLHAEILRVQRLKQTYLRIPTGIYAAAMMARDLDLATLALGESLDVQAFMLRQLEGWIA